MLERGAAALGAALAGVLLLGACTSPAGDVPGAGGPSAFTPAARDSTATPLPTATSEFVARLLALDEEIDRLQGEALPGETRALDERRGALVEQLAAVRSATQAVYAANRRSASDCPPIASRVASVQARAEEAEDTRGAVVTAAGVLDKAADRLAGSVDAAQEELAELRALARSAATPAQQGQLSTWGTTLAALDGQAASAAATVAVVRESTRSVEQGVARQLASVRVVLDKCEQRAAARR